MSAETSRTHALTETTPASEPRSRRSSVVLVVEDNRDILRAVQRTLALQKYEILAATDGEEAIRVARTGKPDLVLLDVMLPKVDGLEVLRRLKADPETRGIMVILVTGRASLDHKIQGFEAGADPWRFSFHEQLNLRKTYRRAAFLVTRLLANLGAGGATPLAPRMRLPVKAEGEARWLEGMYLDQPEEWDDPYRFFRW